jgi:aarF domain-containing kinase
MLLRSRHELNPNCVWQGWSKACDIRLCEPSCVLNDVGNNQSFGSPVNRVKITGLWASRALTRSQSLVWNERLKEYWHHFIFRCALFFLDVAFWRSKLVEWLREKVLGKPRRGGFEEELEKHMREFARDSLGIDVGENVFAA